MTSTSLATHVPLRPEAAARDDTLLFTRLAKYLNDSQRLYYFPPPSIEAPLVTPTMIESNRNESIVVTKLPWDGSATSTDNCITILASGKITMSGRSPCISEPNCTSIGWLERITAAVESLREYPEIAKTKAAQAKSECESAQLRDFCWDLSNPRERQDLDYIGQIRSFEVLSEPAMQLLGVSEQSLTRLLQRIEHPLRVATELTQREFGG